MQEIVHRTLRNTHIVANTAIATLVLITLGACTVALQAEKQTAAVAAAPVVRTSGAKVEPLVAATECTVAVGDECDLPIACTADEALGVWWSQWPAEGLRVRLVVQAIDGQWRPVMVVRPTKAGKWSLSAARAAADGKLFASSVTLSTSAPEPQPDPTPGPTPPGPKVVVIVEESSQRTPAQAKLLLDPTWRRQLAQAGHVVYVADKDAAVPPDLQPYVAMTAGKRLPWLIVATKSGRIVREMPLPTTADSILAALE